MTGVRTEIPKQQRKTRRKPRVWQIAAGLLVCGAIVGAHLLLHYLDSPTSAALVVNQPTPAPASINQSARPIWVTDTYAKFSYPSFLTPLKRQQPNNGSTLASYGYEYHAALPWQLTITINYLSGGLADNDGAYYAMTQNTARYQKTTEMVNGNSVTVMTDLTSDGFSKIAFLFHGAYSADIAVNGIGQQYADQEQAALNQVMQTWAWQ